MIGVSFDTATSDRGRARWIVEQSGATLLHVIGPEAWLAHEILSWINNGRANVIFRYFPAWRGEKGDDDMCLDGGFETLSRYVDEACALAGVPALILQIENEPKLDPADPLDARRAKLRRIADGLIYAADKAHGRGFRSVLGNFATGNLKVEDWLDGLLPLLKYAADHCDRVAIGAHEYTVKAQDPSSGAWVWYEGRPVVGRQGGDLIGNYRHILNAAALAGLVMPNVVITEIGVWPSWAEKVHEDETAYADWLIGLDADLYRQDRTLVGALPFLCGGGAKWAAFDMTPKTAFWERIGRYNRSHGAPLFHWPLPEPKPVPEPEPSPAPDSNLEKRLALAEESLRQLWHSHRGLEVKVTGLETESVERRTALRAVLQQWLAAL